MRPRCHRRTAAFPSCNFRWRTRTLPARLPGTDSLRWRRHRSRNHPRPRKCLRRSAPRFPGRVAKRRGRRFGCPGYNCRARCRTGEWRRSCTRSPRSESRCSWSRRSRHRSLSPAPPLGRHIRSKRILRSFARLSRNCLRRCRTRVDRRPSMYSPRCACRCNSSRPQGYSRPRPPALLRLRMHPTHPALNRSERRPGNCPTGFPDRPRAGSPRAFPNTGRPRLDCRDRLHFLSHRPLQRRLPYSRHHRTARPPDDRYWRWRLLPRSKFPRSRADSRNTRPTIAEPPNWRPKTTRLDKPLGLA
jgi:hypothetical protein